jgi:hypothetical protein
MTDLSRVEQMEQRIKAASPQPWCLDPDPRIDGADQVVDNSPRRLTVCFMSTPIEDRRADARLIASAPTDLAWCCETIRRLTVERDEANNGYEDFRRWVQDELQTLKSDAPTWQAALDDRIAYYKRCESQLAEAVQAREKAEGFIADEGYRRCDIPACNCGSWHGGHAADRLREISDTLADAGIPGGTTIHGGVLILRERAEASEAAREADRRKLEAGLDDDDTSGMAFGAVVAVATVLDCRRLADLTDAQRAHEYSEGPWCWILSDIYPLTPPQPAKGSQGLWEWNDFPTSRSEG